jgi:hypothetical protein
MYFVEHHDNLWNEQRLTADQLIPMALRLFVLLFLSAVGYVVVTAMSPSASRR